MREKLKLNATVFYAKRRNSQRFENHTYAPQKGK